ncbi:MAG: hypothetical protein R3B82_12910 [Sandaracinaceae bacterium]
MLAVALAAGCAAPAPSAWAPLDEPYFRCRVQPGLTRSCSAFACHGDARRPFTVFARNRLRWGGDERDRNARLRDDERAFNYESALGMVDVDAPEESLILRKPLDAAAGGGFHGGATLFGAGDVYATEEDLEYQVLREWVMGAVADPTCVEPGSDL